MSNKCDLQHWTGNLNENTTESKKQPQNIPLFCMKYFLWLLKKHLFTKRVIITENQSTEVSASNLTKQILC